MKNLPIKIIFILSILSIQYYKTNALIEDALDILHLTKEVAHGVLKAWDIIGDTNFGNDIDLPFMREKHRKILKHMKVISQQINSLQNQNKQNSAWIIESLKDYFQTNVALELDLSKMNDIINDISDRKSDMDKYVKDLNKYNNNTLVMFANWVVSPNSQSVGHLLQKLFNIFTGLQERRSDTKGLFKKISEQMAVAKKQVCATQQSAQQFLFSLYSDVALAELKGYSMIQFSWMILGIYRKENYTEEAVKIRNEFESRVVATQNLLQKVLERADRDVWRCDPNKHIQNVTYDEVTRLLQGFIVNEVDMNKDQTCRENCAYYSFVNETYGCFENLYCARQPPCQGTLHNCKFVDSDMWICPSTYNAIRRYEYIEYENGKVLGRKTQCTRGTTKVDSWWRWLFWHCSYCHCVCDEKGPKSDRYFNLRPVISNTSANMVVTGIRFRKINRVFHLQIQEGQIGMSGIINSTVKWKPIDAYNIYDANIISGHDYHTLSWGNRSIDLDDIESDEKSHIVTGIRFRLLGTHLNLEIRLTEYNFNDGVLINPELTSFWKSNDNTVLSDNPRTQLNLIEPDIPININLLSTPTSKTNQYIEFTNSDIDRDAAQSTVPFIDIQDVTSNPPVPLSGIGIYHKGSEFSGGFIAPKLKTFDFTPFIKATTYDSTQTDYNYYRF